jgi:hypothetical protein
VSCTYARRAWTLISTHRSRVSSHRSWDANCFSKPSAVTLAFSFGWCYSWRSMNGGWCHSSIPVQKHFTVGHRAWGVTSQFPTFVSNRSSAFVQVIRLMVLVTQLTAVLHAVSWVTCHILLNLRLCFSRFSRPGRFLCGSESVTLLVDNLYAKAKEALKSPAALSASSPPPS